MTTVYGLNAVATDFNHVKVTIAYRTEESEQRQPEQFTDEEEFDVIRSTN